ncbi:hypothetical protein [Microtetraspora malaysiensis]|uniref:hypothetical protein n=1 Tax=Microtetraspora malaysiensis TaxID=161358 RepID=UPI000A66A366|nr:hypothetical protein [Microtetraspora malaysiensis]
MIGRAAREAAACPAAERHGLGVTRSHGGRIPLTLPEIRRLPAALLLEPAACAGQPDTDGTTPSPDTAITSADPTMIAK